MSLNFYQNIYHTLRREPSRVYIRWPKEGNKEESYPYAGRNMLDKISLFRQLLKESGIRQGDRVLLAAAIDMDLVTMLLAVMAQGAVPVLPPAGIKPAGLLLFLRKKEISALFAPLQGVLVESLLRWLFGVKLLAPKMAAITHESPNGAWEPAVEVEDNQPALISHSSGSTGKSKAIIRSHRTLQAQHEALRQAFPPFSGQHDFPLFPNILLHNLSVGVCSILPCLPKFNVRQMDPGRILKQMQQEGVHTLTGNVYYFKKLLAHLQERPMNLPAVKALGIGGSPVPENLLHELKKYFPEVTIYVIYGSTEAEPIAIRKVSREAYEPQRGYGVGTFHPSLQWRIRSTGQVEVQGEGFPVGEIEVKGWHVVPKGSDGWLATGDCGYVNEEGQLFLTGRKGNEKPYSGVQHYQVEHFLQHIEGVEAAAAIAGEAGFVVYVQGKASVAALENRLKKAFPAGIVQAVHLREKLPLDPRHHSKVLYAKVN